MTSRADARPGRDRRALRQRHDPADRLAEPADLRRRRRATSAVCSRRHRGARPGLSKRAHPRAAWSPAPATPAASSPPPNTKGHALRARRLSRSARGGSTCRSTSTSPAAIIPAPSTMSATSACSAAKVDRRRGQRRGLSRLYRRRRRLTAEQAMAREYAQSVAFDDLPPLIERLLAAWLAHRAAPPESFFEFCRRHEIAALRDLARSRAAARRSRHERHHAHPVADPRERAVLDRAARLAERLLRRLSRRRGGERRRRPSRRRRRRAGRGFPWHDPSLAMAERLALAKDRKPERQLMAAMASSIAASAAISARPMPRRCGRAPRPTWAAACRAARRPSAS